MCPVTTVGFLADYRARTADAGGWRDGLYIAPHVIFGLGLVHTFLYESSALFELTPFAFCISLVCFFYALYFYSDITRTGADPARAFRWTFIGGGFFLVLFLLFFVGLAWVALDSIFSTPLPPGTPVDDF